MSRELKPYVPVLLGLLEEFGFELVDVSGRDTTGPSTDYYRRPMDEHHPMLEFFVQYYTMFDGNINYGVRSIPFDERYHRHVSPPRRPDQDEIRGFLEVYLEEVKDLENIPRKSPTLDSN